MRSASENPFAARHVTVDNLMFIEPPVYLRALMRDFELAGGRIVVRAFAAPGELAALSESVIVNCTGLGARELFGDGELTPIKGQLTVLLPQPEVDYAVLTPDPTFPPRWDPARWDHERGVETLEPNLEAEQRILAGTARSRGYAGRLIRQDPPDPARAREAAPTSAPSRRRGAREEGPRACEANPPATRGSSATPGGRGASAPSPSPTPGMPRPADTSRPAPETRCSAGSSR